MPTVVITCPHCRFSRPTDTGRIPAGKTRVRCPRCGEAFSFSGNAEAAPPVVASPPPLPPADTPAPEAKQPRPARTTLGFAFTGNARDYFGIWGVNTLLTLVTLGVYSPWAKVRKRRYFYGNTLLDGARFEYLADPLALLRGWLIGAALFVAYTLGGQFVPILGPIFGLAIFLAVPWLIVRSRMFNARYSSHRNIRFGFRPEYREAYAAFGWLPVLIPFTLGLLLPYVLYRQRRFLVENGQYGRTPFRFDASPRDFYAVCLKAAALAVALALLAFIAMGGALPNLMTKGGAGAAALLLPFLLLGAGYFLVGVYAYTALANLTWNSTRLGGHRFRSVLRTADMLWIYASNAVAIALSVGLLVPWAAVRVARYRAQTLALEGTGALESFVASPQNEVGAAGEEIGDIFGIEVGF